ncbi:MAG: type I-E CRISPR-associated endoribonuclease Cas2e [Anaerolineae bacterium]|jgi:CRISPR-associated protein Cas2
MLVMILERVTPGLRGELSRWLIEPRSGVFVGSVSAMVRDQLWQICGKRLHHGAMLQIWTTNNEQGFAVRSTGESSRKLVSYEGLTLVCRPWDEKRPTPASAVRSQDVSAALD